LHIVRTEIAAEKYRQALRGARAFIKTYGNQDPLYPDALLLKAESLVGLRNFDAAHKVLQEFLNQFSGAASTSEALRLEFVIAENYLRGVKRRFLGIPLLSGTDRAYEILDDVAASFPDGQLAELALKTKGDHLFGVGEPSLAELEYARILRDYPRSRYHQYSLRRAADSALASFAGVDFDEAPLIEAAERFTDYRVRYPSAADREGVGLILNTIRERRAEKEFSIGAYYEKTRHPGSAIYYYRMVVQEWPDTVAAGKAAARLDLLGADQSSTSGDTSASP